MSNNFFDPRNRVVTTMNIENLKALVFFLSLLTSPHLRFSQFLPQMILQDRLGMLLHQTNQSQ